MSSVSLLGGAALPVMMALAGFAYGLAYFATLKRSIALLAASHGWHDAVLLMFARIAGVIVFFGIAAWLGAVPLLASFLGFLLARSVTLRAVRRAT